MLGGIVAFGLSVNSSVTFAAEYESEEPTTILENSNSIGEEEKKEETDPKILSMEEATEIVEGDAVAEEGYLDAANEAIESENLDKEKAEELLSGGEATLNQAEEKAEQVNEAYDDVRKDAEKVLDDYIAIYGDNILHDTDVESLQNRIDNYEKTYNNLKNKYEELKAAEAEAEERLNHFSDSEVYKSYVAAGKKYDELCEQYDEIQQEIEKLRAELAQSGFADLKSLEAYEQQLERFYNLKAAFEESNAKFEELYNAGAEYVAHPEKTEEAEKWYAALAESLNSRQEYKDKYTKAGAELTNASIDENEHYKELVAKKNELSKAKNKALGETYDTEAKMLLEHEKLTDEWDSLYMQRREASWVYGDFVDIHSGYITVLPLLLESQKLKNRSDESLQKTRDLYSQLKTVVNEYLLNGPKSYDFKETVEDMQKHVDEINKTINYDNAVSNNETVHNEYDELKKASESVNKKFDSAATNNGLEDYVEKIKSAETPEEKIAIIDEAVAALKAILDSYVNENGVDSDEYRNLINEIAEYEKKLEGADEQYVEADAEYQRQIEEHREIYDYYLHTLDEKERLEAVYNELTKMDNELRRSKETIPKQFHYYYSRRKRQAVLDEANERLAAAEKNLFNSSNTLADVLSYLGEYVEAGIQLEVCNNLFTKAEYLDEAMSDLSDYYLSVYDQLYAPYGIVRDGYYTYTDYFGEADRKRANAQKELDKTRSKLDELYRERYSQVYGSDYRNIARFLDAAQEYKEAIKYEAEAKDLVYSADKLTKQAEVAYKLADCGTILNGEGETTIEGRPVVVAATITVLTKVFESTAEAITDVQELCINAKDTVDVVVNITISDATGVIGTVVKNISVPS